MSKQRIELRTADGKCPADLFLPAAGAAKGTAEIILYMDAFGLRASLDAIGERFAGWGYVTLIPDLFYRFGAYGPYDPRTAFTPEVGKRDEIMGLVHGTTQAMSEKDTAAFIAALDANGATGPIGAVGYCMGGSRALTAAAGYPARIAAAASFHGGHLASEAPDSPHRRAPDIKARIYVGNSGVDGGFPPEQSGTLARALREAGVDYALENYVGCGHGWCISDHGVYNAAGAERHFKRLEVLFAETLG